MTSFRKNYRLLFVFAFISILLISDELRSEKTFTFTGEVKQSTLIGMSGTPAGINIELIEYPDLIFFVTFDDCLKYGLLSRLSSRELRVNNIEKRNVSLTCLKSNKTKQYQVINFKINY